MDSSPNLATALGASIEVLGAVYQGLAVVGSTKLFGFANPRRNKVPESEELAYILGSWLQKNPLPEWMSKPLIRSYSNDFGFSTTPTMVIANSERVVHLYHPGSMTLEEREAVVEPLV